MRWLHKTTQSLAFLVIATRALFLFIFLIWKRRTTLKKSSAPVHSSPPPAELPLAPSHTSPPPTSISSRSLTKSPSPHVPPPSLLEAPARFGTPFPGNPPSLSSDDSQPPTPDWLKHGLHNVFLQLVQIIFGFIFGTLLLVFFPQRTATTFTLVVSAVCGSIGFRYAWIAIRLWNNQLRLRHAGVTVIGEITDHRTVRERPTHALAHPQPKYYIRYRYTYNGVTYTRWVQVPQKYYQAWSDGRSIPVRCSSNQPADAYLPEFHPIRSTATESTFVAAFWLISLMLFIGAFVLPRFSEVVNGDSVTPTPRPFSILATPIPPTISLQPTISCKHALCTARQIANEYCIELIDNEAVSPSLYLTPVPSDHTPTGVIVSDCSHEQLFCPTSETAYTNVFVTYYDKTTNTYHSAIILLNLHSSTTGWKISSDGVANQYLPPLPGQECHT